MLSFSPCISGIHTVAICLKIHGHNSAYSANMHSFAYSMYMYRLILHIQRRHQNKTEYSECNYFIHQLENLEAVLNFMDPKPTRNKILKKIVTTYTGILRVMNHQIWISLHNQLCILNNLKVWIVGQDGLCWWKKHRWKKSHLVSPDSHTQFILNVNYNK